MAPIAGESDAAPAHARRSRRTTAALCAVVLAVFLAGSWHDRWLSDDGLIHLRIARQIQAGHGPVFNAGERVEASTSPAWTWLLVAADALLPGSLEWIAVLLGIALSAAGLALAMLGAARLARSARPAGALFPLGACVLAALPAMWLNASTGLENGLVFAWLGACVWRLAVWAEGAAPLSLVTAVLVGSGALVRPELLLVSLPLLAVAVSDEARARGLFAGARALAAAFAATFAYQIFRMGYYAGLGPNSGLAKEAGRPFWSSGLAYLSATVEPYWLQVPLAIALLAGLLPLLHALVTARRRRAAALVAACLVAALLDAFFVVRVGGDFYHARLLLPALFLLLAPVALVPLRRPYAALLVLPWAAASIVALRAPRSEPEVLLTERNPVALQDFRVLVGGVPPIWFDGRGVYLGFAKFSAAPLPGRDPSVAIYGVGAIGYALGPDVYVQDMLGPGDALVARLALARRGWLVGHEKPLPAPWLVAKLTVPGTPVLGGVLAQTPNLIPLDDPRDQPLMDRVADARAALACGPLRELQDAISQPLSARRFAANLLAAPRLWRLRVPPEPRDARAAFCTGERSPAG
jgi:arabinofuranosyltransferase